MVILLLLSIACCTWKFHSWYCGGRSLVGNPVTLGGDPPAAISWVTVRPLAREGIPRALFPLRMVFAVVRTVAAAPDGSAQATGGPPKSGPINWTGTR